MPPDEQVFGQLLNIQHTLGEHGAKLERLQAHVEGLNAKISSLPALMTKHEELTDKVKRLDTESGETNKLKNIGKGVWLTLTIITSLVVGGVSLILHLIGK